jgi:hypothetical protein
MQRMKGNRQGGKGGSFRVSSRRLRGREGRKLPPSLNPQEMMMRRRMKMRKRGR